MTSQAQLALDHDFDLDVRVSQLPSIPQAEMGYSVLACSTTCPGSPTSLVTLITTIALTTTTVLKTQNCNG